MCCRRRIIGLHVFLCIIVSLSLLLPGIIEAKNGKGKDLVLGQAIALKSKVLNEERILLIHEAKGNDDSTTVSPVLYILDGETHFMYISGIVDFMVQRGLAPSMVVVGIKNVDRNRDFTFLKDEKMKVSGGGELFVDFLVQEVFPYIEKNYATTPYRILFGHSLGGMFAVHALTHFPDLFQAYFAISPYFLYGNQYLLTELESGDVSLPDKQISLYLSLGDEKDFTESFKKFEQILQKQAPTTLNWKSEILMDDDHMTLTLPSFYAAMNFLYQGWKIDRDTMSQGIEAIDGHYKALTERFGYPITTPEWVLNLVGYTFMQADKNDEAILILKENVRRFPTSVNVYDSLGEAYEKCGKLDEAEKNFEIAVKRAKSADHPFQAIYEQHLKRVRDAKPRTD